MTFKIRTSKRNGRQTIQVALRKPCHFAMAKAVPCPQAPEVINTAEISISGSDYPGVRFEMMVEPGEKLVAGQIVMRDRRRPEVVFTTPVSGYVERIERGPRRSLKHLVIHVDEIPAQERSEFTDNNVLSVTDLQTSGIWTAFRTRPFGHIPDPHSQPAALFVTATHTGAGAPDPKTVIAHCKEWFALGLNSLAQCFDAPVYLCANKEGIQDLLENVSEKVIAAEFKGGYFAALPGTQIQALCPIGAYEGKADSMVWQLDYQEVIAIGYYCLHGTPWPYRIVTLGPAESESYRVAGIPVGASIPQLFAGAIKDTQSENDDAELAFAERFARQIPSPGEREAKPDSVVYQPLIPTPDLDRLSPPGILATPMLRALLTGDADRVRNLGGLELLEEDLAPLSATSTTGANYGLLLRDVLEQLHGEMHA